MEAPFVRRGFKHHTPFPIVAVPEDQRDRPLYVPEDLIERDINLLKERWEREGNPLIDTIKIIPRKSFKI